MAKVVLVLCDALRDDTAAEQMGYLEHLVEEYHATRYTVLAGLPTVSRACYETIHSGLPAVEHGITGNRVVRRSTVPNLFNHARTHHKTTAAAAYHWISELYVRAPYDRIFDRELDDESQWIQHGRFYVEDDFPDIELFTMGMMLLMRHQPDYLLIHPMGIDYIGHLYGGESSEYRNQVLRQDQILAHMIPTMLSLAYHVIVSGDHGMNRHKMHNGTADDVRRVPLYLISPDKSGQGHMAQTVSQLQIAPTICHLLGIPVAEMMKAPPIL